MAARLRWEVRSGVVPLGRASTRREADEHAAGFRKRGVIAVNVVDLHAPLPKEPRSAEDFEAASRARARLRAAGAEVVNPKGKKRR